jgi:hypothetical protein
VTESASEKRNSLPIGQPEGLAAFADAASPRLVRTWREFTSHELSKTSGVWTLMTVDQQVDGWHVCFMQHWASHGLSVTNAIERLATVVHREACAIAERTTPRGPSRWLVRLLDLKQPRVAPDRFHFYEHLPPGDGYMRETFARVALRFVKDRYERPEWTHYRVIPACIQSARFDCARDAMQVIDSGRTAIHYESHKGDR